MKILIIGGYGAFGGRLARLLADQKDLQIFIGGRTLTKAEKFCVELSDCSAHFTPVKVNKHDLQPILSDLEPDIVVDASGPFHLRGAAPYAVIEACLDAGAHYLDLADGADFVMGISRFDEAAKAKNLSVISGLSTCPALTGAILRDLPDNFHPSSLEIGVAPSPFARMGLSVVQGIFAYAGGNISLRANGQDIQVKALTKSRRKTIAPPGTLPLRNRLFGLVEAPDLQLFPKRYKGLENSWVGAGTRPEYLLRLLIALSKFRALFRLPAFSFLAPIGHKWLYLFSRGEHRGGLYLKASQDDKVHEWHIIAEGDDGPYIPSMAAAALISKWNANPPEPGARPADQELSLKDFQPFFDARQITYGWREDIETIFNFERILSHKFNDLQDFIRALHSPEKPTVWTGRVQAEGPSNILGRIAGMFAGVRVKTGETEATVTITPTEKGEVWERNFGGRKFKSRLVAGTGKNEYLMMEHFGPLKFAMALVMRNDRLHFIPRRWFFLGLPMPQFLLPGGETYETVQDGKFHFNVDLRVPLIGRVAKYEGWLEKA